MLTPIRNDGLVLVTEPLEGAFTILMPEGWTKRRIFSGSTR